ncbi:MAG: insulinase family protein [Oscillospiraceae bacterium]|jgi:predicted Zn-dependent peptidase|nr:insulinase family protein [Oscillospiraceae bacterium]
MSEYNVTRREILPDVELACVSTDKFKSSIVGLVLKTQLCKEHASLNALIPRVLLRGCSRKPEMKSITAELEDLYGTSLQSVAMTIGEAQCILLMMTVSDDKFIPGETGLFERAAAFFGEFLTDPVLENGLFRGDYVNTERDILVQEILSQMNDRPSYALNRLKQEMFSGENFGVDPLGDVETASSITPETLTARYRELIETSEIKIIYTGSESAERVEKAFTSALDKLPRGRILKAVTRPHTDTGSVRNFEEQIDVTQGNIAIGFNLGEMAERDRAALQVMGIIYGGTPMSKLFKTVREKLSLCYFAQSMTVQEKGVMFVISGIDFDKRETAQREILNQLELMKKGKISFIEMLVTKKVLGAAYSAVADGLAMLASWYLEQILTDRSDSPVDFVKKIKKVSKNDVRKMAKRAKLDSVFWLCGKEAA